MISLSMSFSYTFYIQFLEVEFRILIELTLTPRGVVMIFSHMIQQRKRFKKLYTSSVFYIYLSL